jgi:hypothetical protein
MLTKREKIVLACIAVVSCCLIITGLVIAEPIVIPCKGGGGGMFSDWMKWFFLFWGI